MISFVDTNIPIAYVFSIDPHNKRAIKIYKTYDKIYWSKRVYDEFNNRCNEKLENLLEFYDDFVFNLDNWPEMFISKYDLIKYLKNQNYDYKKSKDVENSFDPVLDIYIQSFSYIDVENMKEGLNLFINDLNSSIYSKIKECETLLVCTPPRKKFYKKLFKLLLEEGIHRSDACIVLDAHDYNLKSDEKIDFITFDKDFFNGVCNIKEFSFNKIKGKNNYPTT